MLEQYGFLTTSLQYNFDPMHMLGLLEYDFKTNTCFYKTFCFLFQKTRDEKNSVKYYFTHSNYFLT